MKNNHDDDEVNANGTVKKPSIFSLTAKYSIPKLWITILIHSYYRLTSASNIINSISIESSEINDTTFYRFVHIICKSLLRLAEKDQDDPSLLSKEEEEALMREFSLNFRQFTLVVDCCSYIFEQVRINFMALLNNSNIAFILFF